MNKEMTDLCQWVIEAAKKTGADDCKVQFDRGRFVDIAYRQRKPETLKQAATVNLNLSIFANGRYSMQNTSDLRKPALREFISEALAATKLLAEDPYRSLVDPEYYRGRADVDLKVVDPGYDSVSPQQKHSYVKAMEQAALQAGGERTVSVEASFGDTSSETVLMTSNGFEGYRRGTRFSAEAVITLQDDNERRPMAYDYANCRMQQRLPKAEAIGTNAAERALAILGAKKIETTTLPVIIENRVVPRVIRGLIDALMGWNLYQKRSFLADKKSEEIASRKLTLIDDPFVEEGLGSRLFDDDGIATKKRTIIEAGVLQQFYIDWYYSRKLECEPTTGSSGNMIIPPGTRSSEEIMKDLGRGILIGDFIGGNSNSTTGDFSVGIFGLYFEDGQVVHPVSEMNIADNHLKFWDKLTECANDPWPYSTWRTPSLVFTDVVVSGT